MTYIDNNTDIKQKNICAAITLVIYIIILVCITLLTVTYSEAKVIEVPLGKTTKVFHSNHKFPPEYHYMIYIGKNSPFTFAASNPYGLDRTVYYPTNKNTIIKTYSDKSTIRIIEVQWNKLIIDIKARK